MRIVTAAFGIFLLMLVLTSSAAAQSAMAALDPPPPSTAAADPSPTPATTSPANSSGARSSPTPSFPQLSQDQANGLFDGFLTHGFLNAASGVQQRLQRLVEDANLVTNTSSTWTYQQPTVAALQRAVQTGANAALGLLIFWLGLNVLLRPQLGGSYTEPHEVIPRLMLGAGLANSAGHWTSLAIDVNNTVCANLLAVNSGVQPRYV